MDAAKKGWLYFAPNRFAARGRPYEKCSVKPSGQESESVQNRNKTKSKYLFTVIRLKRAFQKLSLSKALLV